MSLLACALLAWGIAGGPASAAVLSPAPAASGSWTVYHDDPAGDGVAPPISAVDTATAVWTSPSLDGQIYGEPLVYAGRVYVATENDSVYALSASTGAVAWSAHLGPPVPSGSLPCGDITPTVGITGTPVIDQSRGEIFVVADELIGGRPAHRLVGLSTASGTTEMSQDVDPPGADTAALLQRTGLTLDAGQVVFGFGGNDGDCASYRGRVVAVPETGGAPKYFTVDAAPGESQGAVWMGGAAVAGMTVYLPCLAGIIAIRATSSPPALHLLWSSGVGGGPPIVAAGLVWTIGQNGVLYGLDPATGRVRQQVTIGVPANHFPTPSAGGGLLLAACTDNVVAFAAPAPGAQATTANPAQHPRCQANTASAAPTHIPRRYIAAAAFGAAVVIIGLGWLLARRLRRAH